MLAGVCLLALLGTRYPLQMLPVLLFEFVRKPIVLVAGLVGVVVTVLRRRQSNADAALWREATSDSSH